MIICTRSYTHKQDRNAELGGASKGVDVLVLDVQRQARELVARATLM